MTHTTDPARRDAYIAGLRQLASYLDANPGVPVPRYGTKILLIASQAEDGGIREIFDISVRLAAPFVDATADTGSYRTSRAFGPVTYEAVASTEASMTRYYAERSHDGCITVSEGSTGA